LDNPWEIRDLKPSRLGTGAPQEKEGKIVKKFLDSGQKKV
jgi:hypothetical protein